MKVIYIGRYSKNKNEIALRELLGDKANQFSLCQRDAISKLSVSEVFEILLERLPVHVFQNTKYVEACDLAAIINEKVVR